MDSSIYSTSAEHLNQWCRQRGWKLHEGQARFAELIILDCIASHDVLRSAIVLKGGNALKFFYESPRSTLDLDFTALTEDIPDDANALRAILERALLPSARKFNVKTKCQRLRRNPPDKERTRPTYDITIAYQFPFDPYFHNFDEKQISTVVHVEISLNDVVCEKASLPIEETAEETIYVCTREDIVAEKLRSLLQQPIRNRSRSQDVFDIARIVREFGQHLDRGKVAEFLIRKANARGIQPTHSLFDNTVRTMAAREYENKVRSQTGSHFIEFDDAYRDVMTLVGSLEIPQ